MPNSIKGLFLLLFLIISVRSSRGMDYAQVFYLGIENGLSNNEVNCIFQSRNGFMWFGTFDGLNRYDGHQFQIFRKKIGEKNSLINNRIQSIAEDSDSRLWIATMGGVSIYDAIRENFSVLYFETYLSRKRQRVDHTNLLKADYRGDLFVGTVKDGLLQYDKKTGITNQIPLKLNGISKTTYQVIDLDIDPQKRVWVVVAGIGLCEFDRKKTELRLVNQTFHHAVKIQSDRSGHLWLGMATGLYQYEISSGQAVFLPLPRPVTSLHLDHDKSLLIATDGAGIFSVRTSKGAHQTLVLNAPEKNFSSGAISSILKDANGRMWVATLRGGVNLIDDQRYRFKTLSPYPDTKKTYKNYFISGFVEDAANNLWVGTDGDGLHYWNRKNLQFKSYTKADTKDLKSNNITSLLYDQAGRFWVATWGGGISRYNQNSGSFEHFNIVHPQRNITYPNVWTLYEDKAHNIWAGTFDNGGLYRFNQSNERFELFDDKVGNVLSFTEASDGNLWAGTDNKVIRIDRINKKHRIYNMSYRIRSMLEERPGYLWVATEGGGLLLLNTATGKSIQYTEKHGLPNNSVLNILRDKAGFIWLSTFNGLSKFDPGSKKFQNYYVSDGLQSNQFGYLAAARLRSGELVFGGIKGFNVFFPDQIRAAKNKQKVLVTDIRIDDLSLSDSTLFKYVKENTAEGIRKIEIPYNKASLSFSYISLDYSKPDQINYAYFLEGWDKHWINAGKVRTANYSRLKEGTYTLHIRASNPDGVWGEDQLVELVILPPWQRTWWAYTLYSLVTGGLIYLYTRYKKEQTHLAYKVQLAQIETQQEKELNQKKLSYFTNITHELRTPLTLIVNPVKELIDKTEDKLKQELNIIYRNASRLLTLVDQLMLFRTTEHETSKIQISELNLYQLCSDTFESYTKIAASRNIDYQFKAEQRELFIYGDYDKLEIVFFNLLSNAFKFTPNNGKILFEIKENSERVEIQINDSGCGISKHVKNQLFEKYYQDKDTQHNQELGFGIGLFLAKQFVDNHEGELSYTSDQNLGTSFKITLQKGVWFDKSIAPVELEIKPVSRPEQLPMEEELELANIETIEITGKRAMLIVDDHGEMRQYLKKIFESKFVIYEADNGLDGFKLAEKYSPDIILSDVMMEGGNGVDLCQQIKSDPTLNYIPVILLSGLSSAESKLRGVESGADDYIVKPFDQVLLVARINAILDNRDSLHQYFRDNITLRSNNMKISAGYKAFLEECISIVEANLSNEAFNAQWLAKSCNLSYSILYRKVKSISGQSLNAFIRSIRLRKAALLMLSTNTNINEAAFQVGIYDIKFFRTQFKKLYGMNPSDYIKKYRDSFIKEFNVIKHQESSGQDEK